MMDEVTKDLVAAIEAAFREGFRSPTTYNDTLLNSEDEEWEKSDAKAAITRAEAALAAPLPDADGWINPNDKTQKQYLPHIGEKVLFCHAGVTYYGKHTGGAFQSFNPPRMFETWICLWMYPPKARGGSVMTRDDVIQMAREAGVVPASPFLSVRPADLDAIERFAALVLEADDGPWKAAVIDQLIIAHNTITAEHENDPLKAVQAILAYHADIAVDPRVSKAAARLVEQGRAEERDAWHDLTCVIQWLEAGCDPKDAAKELSLYQAAISARSKA